MVIPIQDRIDLVKDVLAKRRKLITKQKRLHKKKERDKEIAKTYYSRKVISRKILMKKKAMLMQVIW